MFGGKNEHNITVLPQEKLSTQNLLFL